jgi:hypothetical protein
MKTTEEAKINEDVNALKDDLSQLRNDLAVAMRSLRYRARNLAADSREKVRAMVPGQRRRPWVTVGTAEPGKPPAAVEPAEPGERAAAVKHVERPRPRYYQRMPGWFPASLRVLGVAFALGMVTTLLLLRRRKVILAYTPPEGKQKRSRLVSVLPWVRRRRRGGVSRTETHEPADWERRETVVRGESRFEEQPLR